MVQVGNVVGANDMGYADHLASPPKRLAASSGTA